MMSCKRGTTCKSYNRRNVHCGHHYSKAIGVHYYYCLCLFFCLFFFHPFLSHTVECTQTKSKRAARSDSVCYYSVYVTKNGEKFPIRNERDEVKKVANLQCFSNISCSGIHSHRNTIQTLKCRHKSWLFELYLNFFPTMYRFWMVTFEWWWVILEKFRVFNDCVWWNVPAAECQRLKKTLRNFLLYMTIPATNCTQKQWHFPEL